MAVRVRGNKGPQCSFQNVNADAFTDLVCQFEDQPENWVGGSGVGTITGALAGGARFSGTDAICIVPQAEEEPTGFAPLEKGRVREGTGPYTDRFPEAAPIPAAPFPRGEGTREASPGAKRRTPSNPPVTRLELLP